MNLVKKSLLVALIIVAQSQPVFAFEEVESGFKISPKKAIAGFVIAGVIGLMGRVWYMNNFKSEWEIAELKKIAKNLDNRKINPGDTPEEISNQWGMRGWRIKGAGYAYRPEVAIPHAHFICLNEQEVVQCLYNDLKNRNIYITEKPEGSDVPSLIKFSFGKPEKSAYPDVLNQKDGQPAKPLTVKNVEEVPSVKTLKDVHIAIEKEIKDRLQELKDLNEEAPFDESLEKLLVIACRGRRNNTYISYIDKKIEEIKKKKLNKDYEKSLINDLTGFKTVPIDDISDLYLFNKKHLYTDEGEKFPSLKTIFINRCQKEAKGEGDSEASDFAGLFKKRMHDVAKVFNRNFVPDAVQDAVGKGKRIMTFEGENAEKLLAARCTTYLKVAVCYARLVKLSNLVSKVIAAAGGLENNDSPEERLKKEKEKVNSKITAVIKIVEELKANENIDYVLLEKKQQELKKFRNDFGAFELIKLYGNVEFPSLLGNMLKKMANDIRSIATYFGPNTPMKNSGDDDDGFDLFSGFNNSQRPSSGPTIYEEGYLNAANITKLRGFCNSWSIGLKELEKQSKP